VIRAAFCRAPPETPPPRGAAEHRP
jgi:hypothetical protein